MELSSEQEELAPRIYQRLRTKMDEELLAMARWMASKADHEIFGRGEFELRDKLNGVGATILQEAANEHPRGGCPVRLLSGLYELNELGLQLRRQAAQVGWDAAEQQLAISDAGRGLEDFARKAFPLAESLFDFFPASEHVAALARACHPDDAAAAAKLTKQWCHKLKHAGGAALLAEWEQLDAANWNVGRSEVHRRQVQYFRNHQHRMDYPRYIANGWQIGSGPVESGCKRLVTQRLKGAGIPNPRRPVPTVGRHRAS